MLETLVTTRIEKHDMRQYFLVGVHFLTYVITSIFNIIIFISEDIIFFLQAVNFIKCYSTIIIFLPKEKVIAPEFITMSIDICV